MSVVVARRELEYSDGDVTHPGAIIIHRPVDNNDHWRCEYEISWPGVERRFYAAGADSWQALNIAMQMVVIDVAYSDDCKAGRLSLWGDKLTDVETMGEMFGTRGHAS